jgi:hypothetical protein
MTLFTLARANVEAARKAIRKSCPDVGSSHASEALAHALGFRTYAALLAELNLHDTNHRWVWLDGNRIADRLVQLGHTNVRRADTVAAVNGLQLPVTFGNFEAARRRTRYPPRPANDI